MATHKIQKDLAAERAPLIWRGMAVLNRLIARNYRRGFGPRKMVLLLTTRGRTSGRPHMTPLQYEPWDGVLYVASARGASADWYRNLSVHPEIQVQIGEETFQGTAQGFTDPKKVADFLEFRLQRHPVMIRVLMWFEGLPFHFTRADLERFASEKAVAAIQLCDSKVVSGHLQGITAQRSANQTDELAQDEAAETAPGERR